MYHWRQTGIQMTLRSAGLMALLVLGTSASGQVNSTAPVADDSGVATVEQESFSGGVSLNGTYFDVRHQTNSGVGYRNGFTQFGAFAPIWGSEDWFVAPNVKMTLTDDAFMGGNAGLVARRYSERYDRIFGVNGYYDNDQSHNNFRYSQFGFGAESLGRIIDVRANGYIPTNSDANFVRATGLSNNLVFFENRLGFVGSQLVEQSLAGADAEIGAPLAPDMPWLRGYVGAYSYRQHDNSTPVGFRGRVEGWITNDLSLGAMVTSDKVFGTNMNFMIDWRFAGFQPTRYFPNWTTRDRMLMPVQRQWRVSVQEAEEDVNIAASNPRKIAAGDVDTRYFVVWVDPDKLAANPGTGTYEDPFHTVPPAVPGQTDLVMVLRGDTTAAAPVSGPITLPNFARMLGEGYGHIADATATFGPFTRTVNDALLPDVHFRDTGAFAGMYPFLTNPAGNIVNVGNHNEIAAFVMENAGGAAIAGTQTSGFNFHHLEIRDNNGGIVLTGAQGSGAVTADGQSILGGQVTDINRNLVVGWANAGGLGDNGIPGGINIATGVAALDLNLQRISMNATPGAQDFGIRLRADQGRLGVVMQDIATNFGNAVAGVSIEQNSGRIDADINSLTSSLNTGVGLRLLSGNLRPMNVTGTNVAAVGNVGDNLQMGDNPVSGPPHNATFNAIFTDSSFANSTAGAGVSFNMSAGIKSLSLTNVLASGNALAGLDLAASGGTLNLTANSLIANNNGLDNLRIGTQAAPLVGTTFTGNIIDSTFNGSLAGSGIVYSQSGGTGTLNLLNVQTNNNVNLSGFGGDGMGLFGSAATVMNIHNTNGQSNFNSRDGFHVEEVGGANVTLVVDPTFVRDNGRDGLFFDLAGASLLTTTFLDDTLTDNFRSAVHGQLNNSQVNLVFNNTTGDRSGSDGFSLSAVNNSVANLTLTNGTSFVDSGQAIPGSRGVGLFAATGSQVNMTMNGTPIGNTAIGGSADYGLTVSAAGVGTNVNVTGTDNNLANVNTNAVWATVVGGAQSTIDLTNANADNAGANGVSGIVLSNGSLTLELANSTFNNAGRLVVGGSGLNVVVNSGGVFNACLDTTQFNNASGMGLRIFTTGAGSESNVDFRNSSADGNAGFGLIGRANAGGVLNFRSVGSSFDGNGTGTLPADGVFVRADGAGSAAHLLFNTTSADNNSRHGFNFEAFNGAYMTARLDSVSAQNNGGYGVRMDAQGAGTSAFLIMEGNNTIAGNTLGQYSLNFNGTNEALVALTGSFNGEPGDGIHIDINNVNTALVSLTGNGTDTMSGNGGDGADIRISNAGFAGVRIAGYSDISNNVEDGVHVELTNITTAAAVEVLGPTAMTDNGDEGVDVILSNVVLGVVTAPPGLSTLRVLTLTDNDSLNACLPEPTNVDFPSLVVTPTANGILLDQLAISRAGAAAPAGQDGISVGGPGVTGTGLVTMTNNTITNYNNGINASFGAAGSAFGGVVIDNAIIDQSAVSGIAVAYNASGGPLSITNSTITNSGGTGLDVALTAAIGGFDITVSDTTVSDSVGSGVSIAGGGVLNDIILTNVSATNSLAGDGVGIVLTGGSANSITLTNVSSTTASGNGILVDLTALSGLTSVTVDGTGAATVTDSGANGILVNLTGVTGMPAISVSNYNLVNNSVGHGIAVIGFGTDASTIDLSNNIVGNSTAGNGIRLELESGIVGPISLTNNTVSNSSDHGINLVLNGVTGGSDLSVTNSNVSNSQGYGIRLTANSSVLGALVFDTANISSSNLGHGTEVNLINSSIESLLVDQYTIDVSSGRGLSVVLDGVFGVVPPSITISNTTVTTSNGGRGVSVEGIGAMLGDVLLDVVSTSNSAGDGVAVILTGGAATSVTLNDVSAVASGGDGVAVLLSGGAVNAVTLTNVSSVDAGGVGVHVDLNTIAGLTSVTVDGGGTAVAQNSGLTSVSDGIHVELANITSVPNIVVGNYAVIDNNNGNGLAVIATNTDLGTIDLSNNTVTRSNAGNGIRLEISGNNVLGAVTLDNNNVSDSTDHGINMVFNGITGNADVTVSNSTVANSTIGGYGIRLTANTAALGDIVFDTATVTNSGGQGTEVNLINSTLDSLTVNQFTIDQSGGRGLNVVLNGVTGLPTIDLTDVTVTNSGIGAVIGRGVSIAGVGSAVNPMFLGTITLTNVSSNITGAEEGVAVELSADAVANGKVGSITLTNVTATNSFAGGILTSLSNMTIDPAITIDGQGTAQSNFNGGDGIRVILLNTVTGVPTPTDIFIDSYQSVANNAGNGIAVLTNGNAVGDVSISNNALIDSSTAGDGVLVDLTGSQVGSLLVDSNTVISNSSGSGINVLLDNVTGTPQIGISNSLISNSGDRGVSVVGTLATLGDVRLTNVSSDGAATREGVAVVLDNGTVGDVVMTNVSALNNTLGGILVDLNTEAVGSQIALDGQGLAQVLNSLGGDGILINLNAVTGIPDVTVSNYVLVQGSVGNGIAVLNNGSDVGAVAVSNNTVDNSSAGDGIQVTLSNAVGSVVLDGDAVSNSSGNGINVVLNGVTGSPDVTISNSTVTDSITGDGVRLFTNGSTLNDLLIDTVSVANSSIDGIAVLDVVGPGSSINSIVLNNVSSDVTFLGTGVTVQLNNTTNITNIAITGTGSVIDSAFDGINIFLSGVVTGTPDITVDGYTVDNSGNRGIAILNNGSPVNNVAVLNNVVTNSLGGDGIQIILSNSAMPTLAISNNSVDASAGNGINLDLAFSSIVADNAVINDNVISNSTNGDGLLVTFNTVSADGLLVDANSSSNNSANGINFDLTNSPIDRLTITNNSGVSSSALSFQTDFFLEHWNTRNLTPGLFIDQVILDVTATPWTYATTRGTVGTEFETIFGGAAAGLVSVNLIPVNLAMIQHPGVVTDGDTVLTVEYTDFDSLDGSVHNDIVMADAAGTTQATEFQMAGATMTAVFSNGQSLTGVFDNLDTHTFAAAASSGGISNNGLDGIRFSLNSASLTNMLIDNNTIATNGVPGTGHGINFETVTNSDITAATISNNDINTNTGDGLRLLNPLTAGGSLDLTFIDNTIDANTGAGVNLSIDANHTGPAVTLDFTSDLLGNQITNNGSFGVHVVATDNETAPITLTVDGTSATSPVNLFGTNAEAGMGIEFSNTAVVIHDVSVNNATFSGTANSATVTNFNGDGLGIRLTNAAQLASLTLGDAAAVNTTFGAAGAGNAGDGFTVLADQTAAINGTALIQNVNALGNTGSGLHIDTRTLASINDLQIVTTQAGATIGSNTLHGIQLNRVDNSQLATVIDGVTITGNTGDGINGFYGNGAGLQLLTIQNSQINSSSDGIDLTVSANAQLLATITDNTLDSNSNNGILVTTNNAAAFGDDIGGAPSTIEGNIITDSLNRATDAADAGMRFDANNSSFQNVLIQASATNRTAISGYGNGINVNNASSFNRVAPNPTQNTWTIVGTDLSANSRDGILLNMTGTGGSVVTIGGLVAANENVTIVGTRVGDTQNGINANLVAGTNTLNIGATDADGTATDSVDITNMGHDGITISQTGGRANVAILNTSSRLNVRRGLNILDSALRGLGATPADTYVVGGGGGARDINGAAVGALGDGNIFSSNDQQGMVFDTLSTQVSNSQFNASDPFGVNNRDTGSTNFTYATLYAIQNTIQNSVNADGMVLSVGSNTRLNAMVSGNTVSANALDDVRIYAAMSVNPASSTNNAPTSPITPNDIYVRDPVAHLDLVFGALDTDNDGIPDTFGTIDSINVGDQVNAVQFGGAGTAAITRTGVFTNADPFKTDRRVQLFGRIGIEDGSGQLNFPTNDFFQLGTQQIMFNGGVFDFLTPNAFPSIFPDPTFLPFP